MRLHYFILSLYLKKRLSSSSDLKTTNLNPWPKYGVCRLGLCSGETACIDGATEGTYICICTHDKSPSTADFKCPRKTVPVKTRPIKIHLQNPHAVTYAPNSTPTASTVTTLSTPASSIYRSTLPTVAAALVHNSIFLSILLLASATLILLTFCWCWNRYCYRKKRKKTKKNKMVALPTSLNNGLLTEDRFTLNPQYSPASISEISIPIPLLSRSSITFCHEIGEGCFGKVFKGEIRSRNYVESVAVKVLKDGASLEAEEDLMREVEIMSAFKHPNILALVGVVPREDSLNPWMVFEYMPYGDLAEVLRSNNRFFHVNRNGPPITMESLCSIAEQIASGMQYLAEQRFVHRDLAARNCLVGPPLIVKIADFGMSRDVYTCDYYKIGGSRLLPVRWMAPESVVYGRFTLESDVWSFGVVLWELYSYGKQPYFGYSNEEVVKLILQGIMLSPPEDCPPFIYDLMSECWKAEPRERIGFHEIHKFLIKAKDDFLYPASTLPRPPALPIATDHIRMTMKEDMDMLDAENYLQPQIPPPGSMREYLQPLPD